MTITLMQDQVAEADLSTPMSREVMSVGPIGAADDRLAPAHGLLLAVRIGLGFWAMVALAAFGLFVL